MTDKNAKEYQRKNLIIVKARYVARLRSAIIKGDERVMMQMRDYINRTENKLASL